MKQLLAGSLLTSVAATFFLASLCFAAGGSAEEAEAMVKRAAQFIVTEGTDRTFAEFTNQDGAFIDRDLYIFVVDFNGITLAHGGNAGLVGRDMIGLRDADGLYFIQEFIRVAKEEGSGWVDYKWVNPTTRRIEHKSTFIHRIDDYFLGCGIYTQ